MGLETLHNRDALNVCKSQVLCFLRGETERKVFGLRAALLKAADKRLAGQNPGQQRGSQRVLRKNCSFRCTEPMPLLKIQRSPKSYLEHTAGALPASRVVTTHAAGPTSAGCRSGFYPQQPFARYLGILNQTLWPVPGPSPGPCSLKVLQPSLGPAGFILSFPGITKAGCCPLWHTTLYGEQLGCGKECGSCSPTPWVLGLSGCVV